MPTISTWNWYRGGRAFLSGRPRPTSVAKGGWLRGAPRSPGAPTKLRILDKHNPLWRSSALPVPALGCARKSGSERRSEEHTSELQSLIRIPYAVVCSKTTTQEQHNINCLQEPT